MSIANDIRTKTYGKDVREAIALGVEQTEAIIADYNAQVINAGNSNAEIVDARGGFESLKNKLLSKADKIEVQAMASGSPKAVATILNMTDTTKNYVNTTDGKWYYWNGVAWTVGGIYQSAGFSEESVMPFNIYRGDAPLVNLFNLATVTIDAYVNLFGAINYLDSGGISDYMPIVSGESYIWDNASTVGALYVQFAGAWYDSSKNFIRGISGTNAIQTDIAPINAKYLRINYAYAFQSTIRVVKGINFNPPKYSLNWLNTSTKWVDKKANFLGDSITFGYGLTAPDTEVYHALLKNMLNLSVTRNYGISGTLISSDFATRYTLMNDDADLVVVFGGINDFYNGTNPIGTIDSTDINTFYGALNILMSGLQTKYSGKEVVFMTPINSKFDNKPNLTVNTTTGYTLKQYVDIIIERANHYSIPVLDLYSVSGINCTNNSLKSTFTQDGVHLNILGNKRIADRLGGFLKTL